ncbi:MAG: HEAT repeat domain-containing protein [Ferruginibacter sp.]|nr:HEAT repeat domain-containing protein [Cytophagales bacterium]
MVIHRVKFSAGLLGLLLSVHPGCKTPQQSPVSTSSTTPATTSDPVIEPSGAQFAEHVRTTEFRTPEQERASFKLPPGFEITLFASEPDISKPINMEFDARGRLWVTHTTDYPMTAAPGQGKDRITILEDRDGDGHADAFTPFAENLNIPIGIMPVSDGAIGYSIPNLYRFTDRDGDGKADDKKVLLGEFGYRDTHGMVSNLIRGFDGWIHSCHGFTNASTIAGTDGDSITMVSGNTFRFRPDGSRVEQTTYGRVNPFGYAFDEWGYLYSVDCHSKPIYQLIQGSEYPHFGKKAPAMGFAPEMMGYELGSTALSGLVYYTGEQFPEAYRNSFYNGDVVTSRINRNTMTLNGSSPVSHRQSDFVVSSDPWFRPVDIKTGPDGSLYVADFYNRIIGHYEVPLDHPGRDRTSGRIWKITYRGEATKNTLPKDWSQASLDELVKNLNHPQLSIRLNIANQLVDGYREKAVGPVTRMMQAGPDSKAYIQGLWIRYRLKALPAEALEKALRHPDPMVQVHALRVLAEMKTIPAGQQALAIQALSSNNPHVQRVATEVLGHLPQIDHAKALVAAYHRAGEQDSHLKYTALISLRNNLRDPAVIGRFGAQSWSEAELSVLMKVMPDVPLPAAASLTLDYLATHQVERAQMVTALEYVARYVSADRFDEAIAIICRKFPTDPDLQHTLYEKMRQGIAQKGGQPSPKMREWGGSLAREYLSTDPDEVRGWKSRPLEKAGDYQDPWTVNPDFRFDKQPAFKMIGSEINWYAPRSALRSPAFKLPASLQMNVFDNDVYNTEKKVGVSRNSVRIRLDKTGQIVAQYRAKFDTLMSYEEWLGKATFDLRDYQGQLGYIEVLDSTKAGSVGIGSIEPALVAIPDQGSGNVAARQAKAAEIVADYGIAELEPALRKILSNPLADHKARAAAADALMTSPGRNLPLLAEVFDRPEEFSAVKEKLALAMGQSPSPTVFSILEKGLPEAGRNLQVAIATVLSGSEAGIARLLKATREGHLNPDVLAELPVKERLEANIGVRQQPELAGLTKGNSGREDRRQLIQSRLASYDPAVVTIEAGKGMFGQHCSMCHQIAGNGGMIGPQLNGIGSWGQQALTEKILNPNGNISEAFRMYNLTLKNGKALSGLYRREEGEVLVFANPGGQEFTVPKNQIKQRTVSKYTLMPDHFGKTIAKTDFDALLKYLLSVKE